MRVLLALCALVAVVLCDKPFCHTCELMINEVKTNNNNDFSKMTTGELTKQMDVECDEYLKSNALEDSICKSVVGDHSQELLTALQQGQTSYQVCVTGTFC